MEFIKNASLMERIHQVLSEDRHILRNATFLAENRGTFLEFLEHSHCHCEANVIVKLKTASSMFSGGKIVFFVVGRLHSYPYHSGGSRLNY